MTIKERIKKVLGRPNKGRTERYTFRYTKREKTGFLIRLNRENRIREKNDQSKLSLNDWMLSVLKEKK